MRCGKGVANQQWSIVGVVNDFLGPQWVQYSLLPQGGMQRGGSLFNFGHVSASLPYVLFDYGPQAVSTWAATLGLDIRMSTPLSSSSLFVRMHMVTASILIGHDSVHSMVEWNIASILFGFM